MPIDANELAALITAYKDMSEKDRKFIVNTARRCAKRNKLSRPALRLIHNVNKKAS